MKAITKILVLAFLAATLILSCNKDDEVPETVPPQVAFTTDKNDYTLGETVFLTNQSVATNAPIVEYYWHFGTTGKGSFSTEENTSVQYNRAGTYVVKLTATDELGVYATAVDTVVIYPLNLPPVADFSYSLAVVNTPVTFTNNSTDADGVIVSYAWDLGNGNTSTEQNPTTTYTAAGPYTVSLTVTDDRGDTNTANIVIQVRTSVNPFGTILWTRQFEASSSLHSMAAAVGDNGDIYVASDAMKLHAVSSIGEIQWTFDLTKDGASGNQESSPMVDADGTIYIGAGEASGTTGRLYAINSNGTEKWNYAMGLGDRIYYTSPAVAIDGNIVIGNRGTTGGVHKVNKTTGGQLWFAKSPNGGVNGPIVVDKQGVIYSGLTSAHGIARTSDAGVNLTPNLGKVDNYYASGMSPAIDEQGIIYAGFEQGVIGAYNQTTGLYIWKTTVGRIDYSGIAIDANGAIYCGTAESVSPKLVALNKSSGSIKWEYSTTPNLVQSTPAIDADGIIHFVDMGGNYIALNPDGTEKLKTSIGTKAWSSPVISSNGVLYVAVEDGGACKLVAIDIGAGPANSPWPQRGQNARRTGQQK